MIIYKRLSVVLKSLSILFLILNRKYLLTPLLEYVEKKVYTSALIAKKEKECGNLAWLHGGSW